LKKTSIEAVPLIANFCEWLEEQKKSRNTILTYQRELERYQEWLQGKNGDISNLSKNDIQLYMTFLEQQGKSPVTIDKTFGAIRTFAKFLKKPEVTFGVQIKPIEKKEKIETLSSNDCVLLLAKVKESGHLRNIAIVYTLLHTGIRVSELCSLNKSDVDFVNNQLVVANKGEKRIIPLSKDAKYHLQNYMNSKVPGIKEEAIFSSKSNSRLTERSIQYILKKYGVYPHLLRHTFCQKLVDKGISLEVVSRLAGHKDINITRRYVKLCVEELKLEEAINKVFINDTLG
jgi:integrase/recombinase XerD